MISSLFKESNEKLVGIAPSFDILTVMVFESPSATLPKFTVTGDTLMLHYNFNWNILE